MKKTFRSCFFVIIPIVLLSGELRACTIPVFRYALDRWPGKIGQSAEETEPRVFREIADRILAGHSAVWIQVDSGNETEDKAAFERLTSRLKFLESVTELPEIDPNDPASQLGPGPELKLKYSTLRIQADDPAAIALAGPKAESLPPGEAWIAPVFGRGRVLGIWPASLMDEEGIDEVSFYLTGACSCQVKAQNPGWDLAINVDWQARLLDAESKIGTDEIPNPETPPEPVKAAKKAEPVKVIFRPPTTEINLTPILAGIALILLLGGALVLFKNRGSKS